MSELPRGTVTFAFTDIEGSTVLLKRLGDAYGSVLAAHRRLVREAFTGHDGVEIDTQGDAFFFAFVRAGDAVAASTEVQRSHFEYGWPEEGQVRVRVGLHTGEPTIGEEGYLGLDVVRAARLCGLCRGGQVLLSETTRALVGSSLPDGVSVFPLGERHLKDIDEPERVYELDITGVELPPTPDPPSESQAASSGKERKARQKRWEEDFESRVESFAQKTAEGILGMLERTFGNVGHKASGDPQGVGGIDAIVSNADELAVAIQEEMRQTLENESDTDE